MAETTARRYPGVIPMITYEDAGLASEWLARAFGFHERLRFTEPDGRVTHVEMEFGDGVIMLAEATPEYRGPKRHAKECEQARRWSEVPYVIDGQLISVDDVEVHFERARAGGARILSPIEETPYGTRHYRAEDVEGHRWMFSQTIRDVPAAEWGAVEK